MTAPYAPPLTLNSALLNHVADIAEALGRWSARQDSQPSPRLRRENRIQTIQASLAIEQNSLSLEQVTALFDGQRVIGPARDIQEVRNAIAAGPAPWMGPGQSGCQTPLWYATTIVGPIDRSSKLSGQSRPGQA